MLMTRQPQLSNIYRLLNLAVLLSLVASCASNPKIEARLPAEYAPVQAVALSWPMSYRDLWPMYRTTVQQFRIAADIQIFVPDERGEQLVRDYLLDDNSSVGTVTFLRIPTHSLWIRDYGPLFVQGRERPAALTAVDPHYSPLSRDPLEVDDRIPTVMAQAMRVPLAKLPLILEGGNVLADGRGACFTSESIRYRNPDYSEREVRNFLRQQLGCETIVMLPVLAGEPTGHVGLYLKLADPQTALVAQCHSDRDQNCAELDLIAQEIARITAPGGGAYHVVRIPHPWLGDTPTGRLYASYVNSVIANGYVFVPQFGLPEDTAALQAYRTALPNLHIIGVDVAPLLRLGGALQCITLPVPVAAPFDNRG